MKIFEQVCDDKLKDKSKQIEAIRMRECTFKPKVSANKQRKGGDQMRSSVKGFMKSYFDA